MSYSLTRSPFSLSALGVISASASATASTIASCDVKTGIAEADAAYKKCCEAAKGTLSIKGVTSGQVTNQIKACSTAALESAAKEKACGAVKTGIYYIDYGFKTCCEVAWKDTGNFGQRAKKLAVCTANAAASAALTGVMAAGATAACAAGGAATFGITTALAATGVCGIIGGAVGSFVYNRISGYSTQSLVLGAAAAAACAVVSGGSLAYLCGFVVAELAEWISDALGPLIEGIFNPDAAAWRKRAEDRAMWVARNAVENSLHDAEKQITEQWKATVNRIWDLYENLFPSAAARAAAMAATGISNNYQSIALALVAAAKHFPAKWEIDKYGGYDAALAALAKGTGGGFHFTILDKATIARHVANKQASCEIYGRQDARGSFGPNSPLCPPLVPGEYWDQTDADRAKKAKMDAAYYKKLGADYGVTITDFFALLPMAETYVATTISTLATTKRFADIQKATEPVVNTNAADYWVVTRAAIAAKSAEAAAQQAKSWSGEARAKALVSVQQRYEIARNAEKLLTMTLTRPPGSAVLPLYQQQAIDSRKRASAAVKLAKSNAQSAQLMVGGAAAAGVAGIGYLLLRRT